MKVVFFGQLKEILGVSQLENVGPFENVALLRAELQKTDENWQQSLSSERCLVAVNHVLSDDSCELTGDEEVAFFPPVTGG